LQPHFFWVREAPNPSPQQQDESLTMDLPPDLILLNERVQAVQIGDQQTDYRRDRREARRLEL
jgi:hypothetical protein